MSMTREQVLAEMEESFGEMRDETKTTVLFRENDQDWTPTLLLEEVRNNTEMGQRYAKLWEQNGESNAILDQLLAQLLGEGGEALTCGQPDCPHCEGEVRPFGLSDSDPETLH